MMKEDLGGLGIRLFVVLDGHGEVCVRAASPVASLSQRIVLAAINVRASSACLPARARLILAIRSIPCTNNTGVDYSLERGGFSLASCARQHKEM